MNIDVQAFVWTYDFISLEEILGVELLIHLIGIIIIISIIHMEE